jgi:hypothetical protein
MRTLRPILLTSLILLLLAPLSLTFSVPPVSAQPSQVSLAEQDLVQAFQSVQTAEQQGASNTDVLPLLVQLNTALSYEQTANTLFQQGNATGSDYYAIQSIQLSNSVSRESQTIGSQAQTALFYRRILAYLLAFAAAIISTLVILESPRVNQLLRKRRLLKARIEYDGATK